MNTDQIINIAALVLSVGAVVYGYVKHKSANSIVAEVNSNADQALKLQATMVNSIIALKELLEPAVKQLPKTRSRKSTEPTEPPSAA